MNILDNEQLAAPQDNHAAEPAMATQVGAVSATTLAARAATARAAVCDKTLDLLGRDPNNERVKGRSNKLLLTGC
jgi:hypothetical protein